MLHQPRLINILPLLIAFVAIVHCAGNSSGNPQTVQVANNQYINLDINTFGEGTEIKSAGLQLMDIPMGLVQLSNGDQQNDSVLVIAIHGYQSKGYEWITGLKNLADHFGSLFFFRYDWEQCPDQIGIELASKIQSISQAGSYQRILLFGHSFGGLIVTYAAAQLGTLNTEIHLIAAPLSGFPGLMDHCETLDYNEQNILAYPEWDRSFVHVIQHRTVHAQDGAFREMTIDPQEIDLPFDHVQELPPTMDGHRLGHNWSVTWVLDQYIGKPHRY